MPRVNIYQENFDALIDDRGNKAIWEQAIVCDCLSQDSYQPDYTCKKCGGSGFRYLPPQSIIIGVTSLSGRVELDTLGIREPGTAYVTPKSDVVMGYRDRLTFPDFSCKWSQVIRFNPELEDTSSATTRHIKKVLYLMREDELYEEGIDYEITEDGYHIHWISEEYRPQDEYTVMSILFLTEPSYLVKDVLHELRGTITTRKVPEATYKELPKQYMIQREDFVYDVAEPITDTGGYNE